MLDADRKGKESGRKTHDKKWKYKRQDFKRSQLSLVLNKNLNKILIIFPHQKLNLICCIFNVQWTWNSNFLKTFRLNSKDELAT